MSLIDQQFAKLRQQGKKAFMPFITAGDPDLAFTARMIREFAAHGCSFCEVGVPYSDPIADGPVIQASYTRALAKKIKLADILQLGQETTPQIEMPLVLMVSYAIVYRHGIEKFVERAQQAGFAGAIVPDLPVEESPRLSRCCRQAGFSLIQLVTPTTSRDRAIEIANASSGFLYYVSVTGITGERSELPTGLRENITWLKARTDLPICVGFGISKPEHVQLLSPVADGLIVGSALVRIIAQAETRDPDEVAGEAISLIESLMSATVNA
jgi:tryptophan synthase alpha chain